MNLLLTELELIIINYKKKQNVILIKGIINI